MFKIGQFANGWSRYYCPVCGHVEWVAPGEDLAADYRCPLCGAERASMIEFGDRRLARHQVVMNEIGDSVWQVTKKPPFHPEYRHYSYVLGHPEGLILYDAPPLITEAALTAIRSIGSPRLLVVSHCDFVGLAGDWAAALDIPCWMGEGDSALPGNRLSPDEFISAPRELSEGLEVVPAPGHSPGSLAVYWKDAPGGATLACGDAIAVWNHGDDGIQIAYFQEPPVRPEMKSLIARDMSLVLACGGALKEARKYIDRLSPTEDNCARPWRGDRGGIWVGHSDDVIAL